jgi:hypothetical protein
MNATAAVSSSTSVPERVAGRYVILGELGVGGMGTVYRARDEADGRLVALKQLIEVYDYGVIDGGSYYTMELLDGKDLMQLGAIPFKEACRHLRDVASSLALIHAHRLLHRDVSPRNVRLTLDGRAKLIDFGALTSFGVPEDIVGTPHCMAPEVLHKMPLDQRADLYALGAVAYFALTGRAAYRARCLSDLITAWEQPPPPPSMLVPGVPQELEALVMSLLNPDPLGRPPTAAAVIDRLTAVAGLEPEEHEHTAQSYLSSSRMVGRTKEISWVERRVRRALRGHGAEIIVEGGVGIGKTRFLHEAGLQATLRGAVVLKADAQATATPFGVAASLCSALLDACGEAARSSAAAHAPILAQLSPAIAEKLGAVASVTLPSDPSERRARFQTALHEWFLDVAAERTLFIAVDNIQAADDNSASFLAALGRESRGRRIVLFATQRAGDRVVAEAPVRMLRQRASRLKLAGLDAASSEELVKSVFGEVPNIGRVARLLFERSAGVPQQFMDLAQVLVRRKIAKYVAGTWVLPQDVATDELPKGEEILSSRLATLGSGARSLAEILCIQSKPVSLERCLALAGSRAEAETHGALDELVVEQILTRDGGSYRFAHGALRDALVAGLDENERRERHSRAAEALLAENPEDPSTRIEAALHLLDACEERRGADMIADLGMSLLGTTYFNAGGEAVLALSRALEVFERQGRSDYELAALLFPMMRLAYYTPHFRLILKHGERTLAIGLRITGLALAQGLRPVLGRKLALVVGLLLGSIGFARHRRRGLRFDLKTAIAASCGILPSVTATFATCLDPVGVGRIETIVQPLKLFGAEHIAGLLYEWAPMQRLTVQGREGEARDLVELNVRRNQSPFARAALGEASWKSFTAGLLFPRGLFEAYAFGDGALRGAAELEGLGIRVWAMAADQIRMLYHAFRGESDEVIRYRDRVELFAVQGSATWQAELFWPALLLNADVLTGDAIAARRTSEQLARRGRDVESLRKHAEAARAAHLLLAGDLKAAAALYERILPAFPLRQTVAYETTRAFYAQALNLAGEHARAKEVVTEVISGMVEQDHRIAVHFLEPQRQLALAEAGLGNHLEAVRILDTLLAKHGGEDNPLLVGLLHKARTEVALAMQDSAAMDQHLRQTEQRFRSTRNPGLIAQWERLSERVSRVAHTRTELRKPEGAASSAISAVHTIAELSAAAEPCDYALHLILRRSQAKSGFLYVYRHDAMHLVAASGSSDAPRSLEDALARLAALPSSVARSDATAHDTSEPGPTQEESSFDGGTAAAPGAEADDTQLPSREAADLDAGDTVFVPSAPPPRPTGGHQLLLLDVSEGGQRTVVGGLILDADPSQAAKLDADFLGSVARVLLDRRVMTSAFSSLAH